MLKTSQNGTKIKPTTLKFLYEFAAIPVKIRKDYLDKLLKRKNSKEQKNVCLLKIIYFHIAKDKMLDWNEELICCELEVSRDMLYCHKSRLLTGLRAYYFKWKEIEKKEFGNNAKCINKILYRFQKAEKMTDIGMNREAKSGFISIISEIESKRNASLNDKIILLKAYRYLCQYYRYVKKPAALYKYFIKLGKLKNSLLNKVSVNENTDLKSTIMLNYYLCKNYKLLSNIKGGVEIKKIISNYKKAYSECLNLGDVNLISDLLFNLVNINLDTQNYNELYKYLDRGIKLTEKHKLKAKNFVFKAFLEILEFGKRNNDPKKYLQKVINNYQKSISFNLTNSWIPKILFQCINLAFAADNKELIYKLFYQYNSLIIINHGYTVAFRFLYTMKISYYLHHICVFTKVKDNKINREYLLLTGTNNIYSRKLENVLNEVMLNFDHVSREVYFVKDIYLNMLTAEFWKGKGLNIEQANYLMKKIEWLSKSRGKILSAYIDYYSRLKFGIKIIEDSKYLSRSNFLSKYEFEFKTQIEKLLTDSSSSKITSFPFYSFIATECGYNEFKEMIKELYFKLEEKYPGIFDPLKKEIEQREKDIHYNPSELNIEGLAA